MYSIEAYGILNLADNGYESSGGDRPIPDASTMDALKPHTLKFIDILLQ